MNGTPRLRSAYPATPDASAKKTGRQDGGSPGSPLPSVPANAPSDDTDASAPLIPFETIDAPTQRFYVFAFWVGLLAWRLYDFYLLLLDDNESLWLFMKWVAIDATFLYGLPALRIPWLEWSTFACTILFVLHAICNLMLMFRIMPPFQAPLIYMAKMLWDKELAISERRVKAADILHNSSLILGRQTIHILPEGSAMLNPLRAPFCLDSSKDKVFVPIMINQTEPIALELARTDFETGQTETIPLAKKALDKMRKQAIHARTSEGGLPSDPLLLQYEVQKMGIYKIQKIIDKSELEVRARPAEVTVVSCPSARISTRNANRCKGDLSDLTLEVDGTPPLKVQYRKVVNQWDQQVMLQSIQPKDYGISPPEEDSLEAVVPTASMDVVLSRKHRVTVPLNESLNTGGRWLYYISEVEDRLGNTVTYPDLNAPKQKNKPPNLRQELTVHDRPVLWFYNCNSQRPLRVAKGQNAVLGLHYDSTGGAPIQSNPYEIEYTFTPEGGSEEVDTQSKKLSAKHNQKGIDAKQPGVYRLRTVSTEFCQGEVYEPSSCLLHNPPEPLLTLDSDQEFDKCAGRPIGLRAKLEFVGTPPFEVHYRTEREGAPATVQQRRFSGMSGEIMLGTPYAGKHRYIFTEISDSVYKGRVLKDLHLEQEIKAIARAELLDGGTRRRKCLGSDIPFHVALQGEAPWKLEYQLLHGGKKIKHDSIDIDTDHYTINTGPFDEGGEYTMSLLSVTDAMGCKETLNQDSSVSIQMNRPKAAFAPIDGKRKAEVLEGTKQSLPVRLSGEGPWTVEYRNLQRSPDRIEKKTIRRENDEIPVTDAGTYELVGVQDSLCSGVVEAAAAQFEAAWIPRPGIGISENSVVKHVGGKFVKHEVCEGDEDNVELQLNGASPFDIQYTVEQVGSRRYTKQLVVPLKTATLRMDTDKSGVVRYHFAHPGDGHYKQPKSKETALMLEQNVHPRPSAKFAETAKTYSFCSTDADGEQIIPITLTGQPPFHVEVDVKHQSSNKPETLNFPNIPSNKYDLRIPHKLLSYGTSSVQLRKVRDARGCLRSLDESKERVLVAVHHAPTITPLEKQTHYCVGDRLSFSLAGAAPFEVFYSFNGVAQRAHSYGTDFRRIAEKPGTFTITAVKDKASNECRAQTEITKTIHEMPSVRISKGKDSVVDIHEGGAAELLFEFGGTPPFEFTYTRSAASKKGSKGKVLETRREISYDYNMRIRASEEGTYEVVSIKDAHCSFSRYPGDDQGKGQKLLQY